MGESETEILSTSSSSSSYGSIRENRNNNNNRNNLAEDTNLEAEVEVRARVTEGSATSYGQRSFWCRIELVAFLSTLASGLHAVIRTNLLIEKVCRVDLNLGSEVCDDISNHQSEQNMVQEKVNDLNLYGVFLASVPCIIISLLVGPYSDKYGRRPLLLIPLLGFIVAQIIYLVNVYYWDASADYLLISAVYSLFGGSTTFLIGVYSYLADTTTTDARTSRVSILDVSFITGYTIGNFCSAIVFEKLGFNGTFGISIGFMVFNFLYIYFFIDESRKPSSDSTREGGNDFCRQLSGIFSAVFMTREGFSRSITILLIVAMLMYVATGSADVNYLFTRRMFQWTEAEFTRVTTSVTVLQTLASLFLLPALSYKLGVPDPVLGLVATLSSLMAITGIALSETPSHFIIAIVCGVMSPQVSTVIRSLLSKTVPEADLGKVYTLLGCLEAATPLAASPLLTIIYNNSLDTFPGAVYLAEAGFMLVDLVLFLVVITLFTLHQRRYNIVTQQ